MFLLRKLACIVVSFMQFPNLLRHTESLARDLDPPVHAQDLLYASMDWANESLLCLLANMLYFM
jgi:hypothetical protein